MNYQFANKENTIVMKIDDDGLCRISFPIYRQGPYQNEYTDWLNLGNTTSPFIKSKIIPPTIPMWAFRTILQNKNLFNQAQSVVDSSTDNALKNLWEYGNTVERESPTISLFATLMDLDINQIDEIFIDADNILV